MEGIGIELTRATIIGMRAQQGRLNSARSWQTLQV
jgi:hypothetical protein